MDTSPSDSTPSDSTPSDAVPPSGPDDRTDVVVVGAGITGLACARALTAAGWPVRVLERSGRPGGRLASPPLPREDAGAAGARPTDLGAAYFTVADDDRPASAGFAELVAGWEARGLAVPWTDTLGVHDGSWSTTTGPQRWAAPGGLRSLVADLAVGLRVETGRTVREVLPGPTVDGEPACAVVLAMPDPQALRLVGPALRSAQVLADREWEPVIAVALGFERRGWDPDDRGFTAAFVNDHPDLALVADDGSRRGDGAPVLVAHTTGERARRHLDDPDGAVAPVVAAVTELLGLDAAPVWTHAHRWTYARPAQPHDVPDDAPFHLDDDLVGIAGDAWGAPKVETAWRSGTLLGRAVADRLRG